MTIPGIILFKAMCITIGGICLVAYLIYLRSGSDEGAREDPAL